MAYYGPAPGPMPAATTAVSAASAVASPDTANAPVSFAEPPLVPFQKHIVAHGILMTVGFLFLLPLGAIIARYMRTFNPFWFKLHWFIQWILGECDAICPLPPILICGDDVQLGPSSSPASRAASPP